MIVSRDETYPALVHRAKVSIQNQTYPNLELVEVRNNDRSATIGHCWNEAIKSTTAPIVMFMGDDDYIAPECVVFLVDQLSRHKHANPSLIGVTCYMMAQHIIMSADGQIVPQGPPSYMPATFTGMYSRDAFKHISFKESLPNQVDMDFFERCRKRKLYIAACHYYFGYFYTLHSNMVSGYNRFTTPEKIDKMTVVQD
jgi:glycosyltransferase involved in cell wall biosynthesis